MSKFMVMSENAAEIYNFEFRVEICSPFLITHDTK